MYPCIIQLACYVCRTSSGHFMDTHTALAFNSQIWQADESYNMKLLSLIAILSIVYIVVVVVFNVV